METAVSPPCSGASAPTQGQVRTQGEGRCLQGGKTALTRNRLGDTLILGSPASRTMRNRGLLPKSPAHGLSVRAAGAEWEVSIMYLSLPSGKNTGHTSRPGRTAVDEFLFFLIDEFHTHIACSTLSLYIICTENVSLSFLRWRNKNKEKFCSSQVPP